VRPSFRRAPQRIAPVADAWASQLALTSLSRPEKPPMPATLAPLAMIAEAALDWLDTAIVPLPCRLTYETAWVIVRLLPIGPPNAPPPRAAAGTGECAMGSAAAPRAVPAPPEAVPAPPTAPCGGSAGARRAPLRRRHRTAPGPPRRQSRQPRRERPRRRSQPLPARWMFAPPPFGERAAGRVAERVHGPHRWRQQQRADSDPRRDQPRAPGAGEHERERGQRATRAISSGGSQLSWPG